RQPIATGASTGGGERDDRKEFDRRHGPERQPGDGEVEAAVHHGQHEAPGDEGAPPWAIEPGELAPRSSPDREDRPGGRNAQPRDADNNQAREQQDRERRS